MTINLCHSRDLCPREPIYTCTFQVRFNRKNISHGAQRRVCASTEQTTVWSRRTQEDNAMQQSPGQSQMLSLIRLSISQSSTHFPCATLSPVQEGRRDAIIFGKHLGGLAKLV